ncbi:MAG: hypothetical protein DLM72_21595 [Candidatus Nitrosopolaris wilkensis]|nr:MAG: hypothetical protein DLM72_21595 [Candidatus Nitrosopolaris wilkensis]
MDSFLISAVIIPLIASSMVLGGLLSISILQLPTIRKNMRMQTEQEIYSRIMEARIRLENTETFTNMAKESPIFAERFTLVNTPEEYYTIMAFLDLIEFLFRLNKAKMVDTEVWSRWKITCKHDLDHPEIEKCMG